MTARIRVAALLASAIALLATPLAAQEARAPMQAEDLVTMPRLGSPAVSPDGTMAVYLVTTTDSETYARSGQLYARSLADMDAKPVALDLEGSSASFGGDGWFSTKSAFGGAMNNISAGSMRLSAHCRYV